MPPHFDGHSVLNMGSRLAKREKRVSSRHETGRNWEKVERKGMIFGKAHNVWNNGGFCGR